MKYNEIYEINKHREFQRISREGNCRTSMKSHEIPETIVRNHVDVVGIHMEVDCR